MGNNRYSMNINEKFLKRNFNGSLKFTIMDVATLRV